MSMILKGIDLPKKDKSLYIRIFNEEIEIVHMLDAYEVEHTNAQAIQIPKGHGRLIDGDYAKYNLENYSDLPTKYLHMDLVREAIEDAPTILEAEEDEC